MLSRPQDKSESALPLGTCREIQPSARTPGPSGRSGKARRAEETAARRTSTVTVR